MYLGSSYKDWRRRTVRPGKPGWERSRTTCAPLRFSVATSKRRSWDRSAWRLLVEAATSSWHAVGYHLPDSGK